MGSEAFAWTVSPTGEKVVRVERGDVYDINTLTSLLIQVSINTVCLLPDTWALFITPRVVEAMQAGPLQ